MRFAAGVGQKGSHATGMPIGQDRGGLKTPFTITLPRCGASKLRQNGRILDV